MSGVCVETRGRLDTNPIPVFIKCPACELRHVDKDEWATKPHKEHLCAKCGCLWTPFQGIATVGARDESAFVEGMKRAEFEILNWAGVKSVDHVRPSVGKATDFKIWAMRAARRIRRLIKNS